MSYYGGWAPYVPVAKRRANAQKELARMRKKGLNVQPVEIAGRKIAASFWGMGWCDHMESFSDYANRLPRGRTYVRNGSVCHLDIQPGRIEAIVSGSELYNISITIAPLAKKKWNAVKAACSGRIGSLIDLLRGKLAAGVMEVVSHRKDGLFPLPGEIKFACDCPDWAGMCKHVAAVLYGVGARLDQEPEKLFLLRNVNHEELIDLSVAAPKTPTTATSRRRLATSGLADVFGVDMADTAAPTGAASRELPVASAAKRGVREILPDKPTKTARTATPAKTPAKGKKGAVSRESPELPEPLTGDAIRAWRASLGETQSVFAKRISVTAASISQWEKKGGQPFGMFDSTLTALRKAWKSTHGGKR